MGFPLLQKPAEMCVGRQIQVLGSYWTGRMSNEEANSLYKYTVCEYHVFHKWDAGGTPFQAKTSWTSTMRCSEGGIIQRKQTFSTVPRTRTQMRELDLEVGC